MKEMADFAADMLGTLAPRDDGRATVLALRGDLGAGKTAFTKALARHLGIDEHVTSPTFVIMKKYPIERGAFAQLVHIDAYRMHDGRELEMLGWPDLLKDAQNLIVIEWPERVDAVLPKDAITLSFSHVDETTREVSSKIQIPKSKQASNSKLQ